MYYKLEGDPRQIDRKPVRSSFNILIKNPRGARFEFAFPGKKKIEIPFIATKAEG